MDSDIVLKIGTWNVQYGRGAEKNATRLGLLLAHKADVWVLTETHSDLDLSPEYTSSTTTPRNSLSHGGSLDDHLDQMANRGTDRDSGPHADVGRPCGRSRLQRHRLRHRAALAERRRVFKGGDWMDGVRAGNPAPG
jgi:hypothetical protein